jgi:hypothetical protein
VWPGTCAPDRRPLAALARHESVGAERHRLATETDEIQAKVSMNGSLSCQVRR